jgi:hypothetical protein
MLKEELNQLDKSEIIYNGSKKIPCSGNACGCTKVKATSGYPNVPKAKIQNNCEEDVEVKITWRNVLGSGTTTHEVWSGETEEVEGPPQYWGIEKYSAKKI